MNVNKEISEYLKPVAIWDVFGISTQQEFVEKFVTKGIFHKNVPEKIVNDYHTVERLQFYSYYHYPLIDEAFGKSTRIFEASIDLKISELDIAKKGFESLNSKIKRLEAFTSGELHKKWLHAKEMRNMFAHHKAGRLMGIVLLNAFKHNINMINSVFLGKKEIIRRSVSLENLKENAIMLNKGLFVLKYKSKRFLIWSLIPYSTSGFENGQMSFWVMHPVYGEKAIKDLNDIPSPFMFNLENVLIENGNLSANVIETNEEILVKPTSNPKDIELYKLHQE
uniref:hypothetical protein n=1 Tax=Candidatus Ulvibacter alkanivorans TaxID=2267620 RepID=UPI00109D765C